MSFNEINWSEYPDDMSQDLRQVVINLRRGVQVATNDLIKLNRYLSENAPQKKILRDDGFDWLSPIKTCK